MSSASLPSSSLVSSSHPIQSKFHLQPQRCSLVQLRLPKKPLSSFNFHSRRLSLRCRCNKTPGGSDSGENESKIVLDAFFLGKAIGEALSERIESTVGEFVSTIGRLQAEQQKQVLEFQEEVLHRAKMAKEKAAHQTFEAQGLTPKPATPDPMTYATVPPSQANTTSSYPDSNFQAFNRESDSSDEGTPFGSSDKY
ncbi:unnamed protein product [Cuscuta campestris]|uniref:Uncharacterized protein n=1 Tax=Cuscuta campestris TaxID=132261 RepID=A0A484KUH2_9ASTE|nr:unnamed protein product [Cuscuta campestris]